ncbi:MAG: hypothetical protein KC431_27810, partial [Myxococcales bacterium]|nr:hypothetical protein [Myxococcales bacterium]
YPDMSAFVLALKEAPDWAATQRRRAMRVTAIAAFVTLFLGLPLMMLVRLARETKSPLDPATSTAESNPIDEVLSLIDEGKYARAQERWKVWFGHRYARGEAIREQSLKVGQAFLTAAKAKVDSEPSLAFELAGRAVETCQAAQLDPHAPLCANKGETASPQEFRVEGENQPADDPTQTKPKPAQSAGGGETKAAAFHSSVQALDPRASRRLHQARRAQCLAAP